MKAADSERAGTWPVEDLEPVPNCPICGGDDRHLLFDDLEDRIFGCAPGKWRLFQCRHCASGYLDPRPTRESIGRAYDSYYTHQFVRVDDKDLSPLLRMRRALANGYKNRRFGTRYDNASAFGTAAAWLVPGMRVLLERQSRGLKRGTGRVLDVGFGDGSFLRLAADMGWEAVGVDPDPVVVENARAAGIDGRVGTVMDVPGRFDAITLCHVIEHVHDPVETLQACFDRLNPGGAIWIETPNINSLGLKAYGADWRGLEPPRHLALFSRKSLRAALEKAGFVGVRDLAQGNVTAGLFGESEKIRRRHRPAGNAGPSPMRLPKLVAAYLREQFDVESREFIGMTGERPRA